jgi:predicted methyltransferase
VRPGDTVVDATCGNGYDTLFLAELVGESGNVWGFDIQADALSKTAERLQEKGVAGWVHLVEAGHERMGEFVPNPVKAAVFNLGYLPGGNKGLTTQPETTAVALSSASQMVAPGGIVAVVVYTGHEGGSQEARVVDDWGRGLIATDFTVWSSRQLNRSANAPYLIFAIRAAEGRAD